MFISFPIMLSVRAGGAFVWFKYDEKKIIELAWRSL